MGERTGGAEHSWALESGVGTWPEWNKCAAGIWAPYAVSSVVGSVED